MLRLFKLIIYLVQLRGTIGCMIMDSVVTPMTPSMVSVKFTCSDSMMAIVASSNIILPYVAFNVTVTKQNSPTLGSTEQGLSLNPVEFGGIRNDTQINNTQMTYVTPPLLTDDVFVMKGEGSHFVPCSKTTCYIWFYDLETNSSYDVTIAAGRSDITGVTSISSEDTVTTMASPVIPLAINITSGTADISWLSVTKSKRRENTDRPFELVLRLYDVKIWLPDDLTNGGIVPAWDPWNNGPDLIVPEVSFFPPADVYQANLTDLKPNSVFWYVLYAKYSVPFGTMDLSYFYKLSQYTLIYVADTGSFATLATVPSAPLVVSLKEQQNGSVVLEWSVPKSDGGYPVDSYIVRYNVSSQKFFANFTTKTNSTTMTITSSQLCGSCFLTAQTAAVSRLGAGTFSIPLTMRLSDRNTKSGVTVGTIVSVSLCSVVLALVAVALVALRRFWRKKRQKPIVLPKDLTKLPQVPLSKVSIFRELGSGCFGKVYEGFVSDLGGKGDKAIRAAFKTLKEASSDAERYSFVREALTMRNLHHPYVVSLLGLCVDGKELWLILEMMDGGNLHSLLREHSLATTLPSVVSSYDLLRIALQICEGCCYLHENGYIHRDLAARNCLVSCHDITKCDIKIADFGLSLGVYEKFYCRLPDDSTFSIRWSAPEVLTDNLVKRASDVWSFGVVLWEIMTLGHRPYGQLDNEEVIEAVQNETVLEKPKYCSANIYNLMHKCFAFRPSDRPTFASLHRELTQVARQHEGTQNIALIPASSSNNTVDVKTGYVTRGDERNGSTTNSDLGSADLPGVRFNCSNEQLILPFRGRNEASLDNGGFSSS